MKGTILQFIVVALVLALSLRGRSGDTVLSYMLWVILKTSIISPRKRLYFRAELGMRFNSTQLNSTENFRFAENYGRAEKKQRHAKANREIRFYI